jgi:Ca2+-transporting ATPase
MRRPSRSPQESILGEGLWQQILVTGALIAAASLLAGTMVSGLGREVQTGVFVALGVGQLSVAWALRAPVRPRRLRDRAVEGTVLLALVFQLLGVYVPALNELLSTTPLPVSTLLAVSGLAVLPGVGVYLSRRRERGSLAVRAA